VNISLLLVYKQKFHTGEAGISRFAEAFHFSCKARKKRPQAKPKDAALRVTTLIRSQVAL